MGRGGSSYRCMLCYVIAILLSYKQLLLLMLISDNTQPLITAFVCPEP